MAKLDTYLAKAKEDGASDIHFSSRMPVGMRIDGDLIRLEESAHEPQALKELLFEILSEEEREKFNSHHNLDKSYRVHGVANFRVNMFMAQRGIGAVFRIIPHKVPTVEQLGLPPIMKDIVEVGEGLVLVTGPTGSGKSTTLAALINHLNATKKFHILTVEDPVEFVHESQQSLINQREIGSHVESFSDALKYALREDPDVILVGEMRDLETIALAMTAAETGHLVFGTLHTRGAAASVDRIIDSFPANQQAMIRAMLSESLAAVISQALLKKSDGKGRVAAYEIMIVNHAIANLIREGKTYQITSTMQTAKREGMVVMDHHLLELIDKKMVNVEEAEQYMQEPSLLGSRREAEAKRKRQEAMRAKSKTQSSKVAPAAKAPSSLPQPKADEAPKVTESKVNRPQETSRIEVTDSGVNIPAPPPVGVTGAPPKVPSANQETSPPANVPVVESSKPTPPSTEKPGEKEVAISSEEPPQKLPDLEDPKEKESSLPQPLTAEELSKPPVELKNEQSAPATSSPATPVPSPKAVPCEKEAKFEQAPSLSAPVPELPTPSLPELDPPTEQEVTQSGAPEVAPVSAPQSIPEIKLEQEEPSLTFATDSIALDEVAPDGMADMDSLWTEDKDEERTASGVADLELFEPGTVSDEGGPAPTPEPAGNLDLPPLHETVETKDDKKTSVPQPPPPPPPKKTA